MSQIIVYNDNQTVCVVWPTGELPTPTVARKDVPQGVAYLIMDSAELPDREFRDAWEADIAQPDGYGDPAGYWAEMAAIQAEEAAAKPARRGTPV